MKNPFRGLGVALVTPFDNNNQIDFAALESIVEHLISKGVDFLCVLGTTAETPTLTHHEKKQIMETVVRVNRNRVPLLLGMGGNCTDSLCSEISSADLSGYQGLLVVAPYYNKPSQEGVYQHYTRVCESTSLPVVIYNIPGRTGINIAPETIKRIADRNDNIVAIKEASGNLEQARRIMSEASQVEVLSGDDSLTLELMREGAVGVISVIANAYPAEFKKVVEKQDICMQQRLSEVIRLSMADGNPAGIKSIMNVLGYTTNTLRLPLVPVNSKIQKEIEVACMSL